MIFLPLMKYLLSHGHCQAKIFLMAALEVGRQIVERAEDVGRWHKVNTIAQFKRLVDFDAKHRRLRHSAPLPP
jgi:hypothetical protein